MKRIIIALALTFIALSCYAGTDDTGLQVYTIKGEDMMGGTIAANTEGLKFGQGMQNFYNNGNGLCTFRPNGSTYYPVVSGAYNTILFDVDACYDFYATASGSQERTFFTYFSGTSTINLNSFVTGTNTINKVAKYTWGGVNDFCRPFFSPFNLKIYVFTSDHLYTYQAGTTAEVTVPWSTTGDFITDASYHKNRIFCSGSETAYLYYSSALNYGDFTNEAGKGGTIKFPARIRAIKGTQYGLYVFTSRGLYLLSGTEQPSSWKIELIIPDVMPDTSVLRYSSKDLVYSKNNVVYFIGKLPGDTYDYKRLYSISGYEYKEICKVPFYGSPDTFYAGMGMLDDNTLVFGGASLTAICVDIKNGSLSSRTDITGCSSSDSTYWFWDTANKNFKIYLKLPQDYSYQTSALFATVQPQFYYKTPVLNFGSGGTHKEISRIEVDYLFPKNFVGANAYCEMYFVYPNMTTPSLEATWIYSTSPMIGANETYSIGGYQLKQPYKTFVWNAPAKVPVKRCYIDFHSAPTMSSTYAGFQQSLLKEIRIFYRDLGAYKK